MSKLERNPEEEGIQLSALKSLEDEDMEQREKRKEEREKREALEKTGEKEKNKENRTFKGGTGLRRPLCGLRKLRKDGSRYASG